MSVIAAMSRDRFFLYLYWHQNHSVLHVDHMLCIPKQLHNSVPSIDMNNQISDSLNDIHQHHQHYTILSTMTCQSNPKTFLPNTQI